MVKRVVTLMGGVFLSCGIAFAQSTVTGIVTSSDDGDPVVGASVRVEGTNTGTVTDIDGKFRLSAPSGAKLTIQYLGMRPQTVKAGQNLKVVLDADSKIIDEVIITGYGNFKKSSFTGAAATMSTENLSDVPTMSVEDKLAGNIPGVSISSFSGQPGAVNYIRIRGMGSINAGNDPLIVIDGTPVNSGNISGFNDGSSGSGYNGSGTNVLSTLNSNDIESMTVIKDAAAASLYGSRAANGVIVITTKSGKTGKTHVDFRSNWGFSNMAINYRPTLSGDDQRALIYEGLKNYVRDGNYSGGTDESAATAFADANIDDFITKPASGWTDWRDILFKKGSQQNYEASVSGGNDRTQFYSSLAYGKQNGVVNRSGLERMTGNANLSHTFGRLKLDVTTLFSKMHQSSVMDGGASYASELANAVWFTGPQQTAYDENGNVSSQSGSPYNYNLNPLYENEHSYDRTNTTRSYSTMALSWRIWDALKLRGKIAYDYINSTEDVLWDRYSGNGGPTGIMQRTWDEYSTVNTQTQLSYIKSFGLHNVDALFGFETEAWHQNSAYMSGENYPGELYEFANAGDTSGESYKYDSKMTSVLGRVNYNYNERYYFGGSWRTDGSSRLARDNRWGTFWSLSGAWRFGSENFMKPVNGILSDGKLRVSYGVNGTLPSGLYSYMNLYRYGEYYNGSNGMGIVGIGNPDLKWEKNKAWNFGLDLTFIERIGVTLDYYVRNTSDLIMNRPVSYVPGYYNSSYGASVAQNVGSMRNQGIEVTISSTNISRPDFTWTTSLNFGHNSNKVTKLTGDQDQIISGVLIHEVGKPYYSYYMYEYAGVDPETGLESYYINGDGDDARQTTTDVSKAHRTIVGKHDPAIEGGFSNNLKWKFIDFNFTLTYKLGGDSYDYAVWLQDNGGIYALYGAIPDYYKLSDMWTPENHNAKLPKFQPMYGDYTISSRWLMPNDYLRLKNLTIGFSAPRKWLNPTGLSKARVYFSANNLLTWKSKDLYVDPETPVDGLCTFEMPALRTYTFGIELSF